MVIEWTYEIGQKDEGKEQVYLQVNEVSLINFLSTKANPCRGYTSKKLKSSHKCSSNN